MFTCFKKTEWSLKQSLFQLFFILEINEFLDVESFVNNTFEVFSTIQAMIHLGILCFFICLTSLFFSTKIHWSSFLPLCFALWFSGSGSGSGFFYAFCSVTGPTGSPSLLHLELTHLTGFNLCSHLLAHSSDFPTSIFHTVTCLWLDHLEKKSHSQDSCYWFTRYS